MQHDGGANPMAGLLRLVGEGGLHSTAALARRLGLSEALIVAITADLTRRGYLAPLEGSCATTCEGCGIANACAAPASEVTGSRLLSLTAKGRTALRLTS